MTINSWDLRTDTFGSAAPGSPTTIRLTHLPTGLEAEETVPWGESQLECKSRLILSLEARVRALRREELVKERVQGLVTRFGPVLKRLEESERAEREAAVAAAGEVTAAASEALDELNLDLPAPCFHCGKELEPVFREDYTTQPYGAVTFSAYGQYGSAVFDPPQYRTARETLSINVCDECLVEATREMPGIVRHLEHQAAVTPPPRVTAWAVEGEEPSEAAEAASDLQLDETGDEG